VKMECGFYDSYHGSKTFGHWVKCGDYVETGRSGVGSYPTIHFKCSNCGKLGEL
jgi:hypothetical protein